LRSGRYNRVAYMFYHHTCSIHSVYLIKTNIHLHYREFVQVASDVICGRTVSVPDRIQVVGGRRGRSIRHLLRTGVILVEVLPTATRRMTKLAIDVTLMVFVGVIRVTRVPTTRMTATAMVPLKAPTTLLLGSTSTRSSVGEYAVLLLLCLLCDEARFNIKETRI
jgi:hypothetical protein